MLREKRAGSFVRSLLVYLSKLEKGRYIEIGKVVSDLGFSLILIAIALAPRVIAVLASLSAGE